MCGTGVQCRSSTLPKRELMKRWLASMKLTEDPDEEPVPEDALNTAVVLLKVRGIEEPKGLLEIGAEEARTLAGDPTASRLLVNAVTMAKEHFKPEMKTVENVAHEGTVADISENARNFDGNPDITGEANESEDVCAEIDEIEPEAFAIECWSVPTFETSGERMEYLVKTLYANMRAVGMIVPENCAQVAACESGHGHCFLYQYGTKRVHITERKVAGRIVLIVRCGGGFLDFVEFSKRYGKIEQSKLARDSDRRVQMTSVLSKGRMVLKASTSGIQ
eukprot:gnl/MRDRNA2_/MRDRNA2_100626_c0_seq1.p1 gnl/MRDRNA2_/MRDRNA2_100626_c0~~gnl/MRDRNA2_/MRDRNA2_100626_c0_seq1.p1  ORF type:complete len:277 (-),score=64.16 gnl/MRDRNA2_/MRDRNA2_100626_c0_seq1:87-917(-)